MNNNKLKRALFVMPSFSKHADRMGWQKLEDFYNPEGVFEEVTIISMSEINTIRRIGSLRIIDINTRGYSPRLSFWIYKIFGFKTKFYKKIIENTKKFNIDILIQRYGGIIKHGVPILVAAKQTGLPSVITVQNAYDEDREYSTSKIKRMLRRIIEVPIEKYCLLNATKVWLVSEYLKKYVSFYGNYNSKITVIYNKTIEKFFSEKIDEKNFKEVNNILTEYNIKKQDNLFLSVGRLIPQKNYSEMIKSFQEYLSKGNKGFYIIIGNGIEFEQHNKYIKENRLEDNIIILTKYFNIKELGVLYRRANALLFCSVSEGQGRVVFESLAFGTPVIGLNMGPIPEMITHNFNGFLVNPNLMEEITDGLIELSNNNSKLSSADCRQSSKKFFMEAINTQESKFYRSMFK